MAYRYGNRHEQSLFPASIEDYVSAEAPVRVYDFFVEALDFGELGVELDPGPSVADPDPEGQAIYKLRKQKVELPFGHMKRNLNVGR